MDATKTKRFLGSLPEDHAPQRQTRGYGIGIDLNSVPKRRLSVTTGQSLAGCLPWRRRLAVALSAAVFSATCFAAVGAFAEQSTAPFNDRWDQTALDDRVIGSQVVPERTLPAPESIRIANRFEARVIVVPDAQDPASHGADEIDREISPPEATEKTSHELTMDLQHFLAGHLIAADQHASVVLDMSAASGRQQRNLMDTDESQGRKPEVAGGRFTLPELAAANTSTTDVGNGRTPEGFRAEQAILSEPLAEIGSQRDQQWTWATRSWAAPNTFSYPRYFEDRMLERHGHERFPHLTPMLAGMRFFTTVPLMPYLTTVSPPCECQYSLGYYRSGSCVPAYLQRPPYERAAVIAEAAAVTGAALIP